MFSTRAAGILLHPTSLPGPFANGDLGHAVDRFLDWCVEAGQSYWQILPLGPTGYGNSPYGALSAFAGNPELISPELLVEDGLLTPGDLSALAVNQMAKEELIRAAWRTFSSDATASDRSALTRFREQSSFWLDDWCLYRALKSANGGRSWMDWEPVARDAADRPLLRSQHEEEYRFAEFVQYIFARQWSRVREAARVRSIRIIGDAPIYVAHDSADVWGNRRLFRLDSEGRAEVVAGVPPDYFSVTGQLWGNPLYDWDQMAAEGYEWWIQRAKANLALVDLLRLDHFRGFAGYWEVPADHTTAEKGQWRTGPGAALFQAIASALGNAPFIAEDLGLITPDVDALRESCGFPGMRVLQFAFGEEDSTHLPAHYLANSVAYTGTHDNPTVRQWYDGASAAEKKRMDHSLGRSLEPIEWRLIRAAYESVAALAITPMQDVLGLGVEGRMNTPGKADGNWSWRASTDDFTPERAERLRTLAEKTGRVSASTS